MYSKVLTITITMSYTLNQSFKYVDMVSPYIFSIISTKKMSRNTLFTQSSTYT